MKNDLFLLDPGIVFLNHGSFGACPREVFDVYQQWQRELERKPVEFLGRRSADLLESARNRLAGYLKTSFENIVFVTNTTTAVNAIARSLSFQPDDEILTTDHEYGACDNTWEFVCQSTGATYRKAHIPIPYPGDAGFVELFMSEVTERTKAIFLSHITSFTAFIFPVAEICKRAREKGILTIIDGAHVPGHIQLDLDAIGADIYTGNCHKWLCAPKGSAFLYCNPELHSMLHGLVISWGYSSVITGHTSFDAYTGSSVFVRRHQWQGTRDISSFLSVPAAIDFQEKYKWDDVRIQCHRMAIDTMHRVNELTGFSSYAPDESFGQMAIIPMPPCDPERLKNTLYDLYNIEVPVTNFGDQYFVRVSFQGYNTPGDADRLIEALRDIFRL